MAPSTPSTGPPKQPPPAQLPPRSGSAGPQGALPEGKRPAFRGASRPTGRLHLQASGRVRPAHAEGLSRQPGTAARGRRRLLLAAVADPAADPDRHRPVARDRRGGTDFTLGRYLEWLAPGQSASLVRELSAFLEHRNVVGWILLATMLFFSSLAFTVLENAMSVIFHHRVAIRRRRFLVSAILPYCYILCLGVGLLIVTVVSNDLQRIRRAQRQHLRAQPARSATSPASCCTCSAWPAKCSCSPPSTW